MKRSFYLHCLGSIDLVAFLLPNIYARGSNVAVAKMNNWVEKEVAIETRRPPLRRVTFDSFHGTFYLQGDWDNDRSSRKIKSLPNLEMICESKKVIHHRKELFKRSILFFDLLLIKWQILLVFPINMNETSSFTN